tara:strand:- start:4175 stop:9172 length:4998 start_codon:yes stop_codon:yes gene_type:complete
MSFYLNINNEQSFQDSSDKKNTLNKAQQDFKDNYVTTSVYNRSKAIYQAYPLLPSGVNANLAITNATNDEVRQVAQQTYRTQALQDNEYGRVPEGFFTKLKRAGRDAIDPFMKVLNVGLAVAEHITTHQFQKQLRANIAFAGDLEKVLGEALEKDDVRFAKQKAKLGALATSFFVADSPFNRNSSGGANAITNVLANKLIGKDLNLPLRPFNKILTSYYEQAGPSGFEYTLRKLSEEQGYDPDKYLSNVPDIYKKIGAEGINETYEKYLGKGLIPWGSGIEESERLKRTNLQYNDQSITLGKYVSNLAGIETKENEFNFISGVIDAGLLFATDPFAASGKARAAYKALKIDRATPKLATQGKQVQNQINKLKAEGNIQEANRLIEEFTKSPDVDNMLKVIVADNSDTKFIRLFDATGDANFSTLMTEAPTYRDAKKIFRQSLKSGPESSASKLGSTKIINDWVSDPTYKTFWSYIKNNQKQNKVYGVFGSGRNLAQPSRNLEDINGTITDIINYGAAAKLEPKIINQNAAKIASLINKGELGEAKLVFHKDFMGAVVRNLEEFKADKEIIEGFEAFQNKFMGFRSDGVQYSIDQETFKKTGALRPILNRMAAYGTYGNTKVKADIAYPHQITDYTVDFINLRQLRNQASTVGKILNNKRLSKGIVGKFNDDTTLGKILKKANIEELGDVPGLYWTASEFLWTTQKFWKRNQLVTRVAYPLRLVGEGQARMWLFGLDGLFNSPLTYLSYFLQLPDNLANKLSKLNFKTFDEDVMGNKFIKGITRKNRKAQPEIEAAVGGNTYKELGPSTRHNYYNENYSPFFLPDEQLSDVKKLDDFSEAILIQYNNLAKEDLAKEIADALSNNKSLDDIKNAFWQGDLQQTRERLTKLYELGNVNRKALLTKFGSDEYINSYAKLIGETVGYDKKLLNGIATGMLDDVDITSFARFENANKTKIKNSIKEMLNTSENRPGVIPAPDWLIAGKADEFYKRATRETGLLWYYVGQLPEERLNRIPSFKQFYFRRIKALLPHLDESAKKSLQGRIDKLPKELIRDLENVKPLRGGGYQKYNLEEASQDAMEYALEQHNKILYNLSQKGLVSDSFRFMFPFLEAYKEVATSWGKGLAQKPYQVARTFYNGVSAGRKQGIVYKDFRSGEDFFVYPQTDVVQRILVPNESQQRDTEGMLVAPLGGLNLISTSLLPGLGPAVSIPAGLIKTATGYQNEEITSFFFPYGLPSEDIGSFGTGEALLTTFLPGWGTKFLTAWSNNNLDGFRAESFSAKMNESIRVLALTENQPLQTTKDFKNFQDRALELTKDRVFLRSFAQFLLPAAPRIIYTTEFVEEDAENLLKAVVDTEQLGKLEVRDRKHMVELGVLAAYQANLEREAKKIYGEDGEEIAFYTFVRNLGLDKTNLNDLIAATVLSKGKYRGRGAKEPQFEGEVEFARAYPGLIEKYPLTAVYLTPDIQNETKLDQDQFFQSIENLQAIDPAVFLVEAQEFLYSMLYNNLVKPLEGDYSLEATLLRDKAKTMMKQTLPLGDPYIKENLSVILDRNIKTPYRTDIDANILELEEIAKDEKLKDIVPVWEALSSYMELRSTVLASISTNAGRNPEDSIEYAKGRLRNGESEIHLRSRNLLSEFAKQLVSQYPEFLIVYDDLLRAEVEYNRVEE